LHPFLITIGWLHLPTYGTLLVLAILGGIYTAMRLGRRVGLQSAQILDFCTWGIIVALVGAKVLMVLTEWGDYTDHFSQIFSLSTFMAGGVFYGGFLAGLFFTIWYVRVQKIPFWKLTDVLAPGLALGQSVGRLGCFSAGCDYGKPTTLPWGVIFTSSFAHQVTNVPLGERLHPTQLYESLATFAIFGFLLWWFPRKQRDGDIFLGYMGLYAVARFFLEFLRGDEDRGFVFNHLLSTSQFIALLALAGIAVVFIWRRAHPVREFSAVPASRNEQRGPQAGEPAQPDRFERVPAAAANVTTGKARGMAVAPAPKRAKR
jgi:phosphatidylglycerol:prolipoprotein diacylglycerol transferase